MQIAKEAYVEAYAKVLRCKNISKPPEFFQSDLVLWTGEFEDGDDLELPALTGGKFVISYRWGSGVAKISYISSQNVPNFNYAHDLECYEKAQAELQKYLPIVEQYNAQETERKERQMLEDLKRKYE